jgi:hypothetical protein
MENAWLPVKMSVRETVRESLAATEAEINVARSTTVVATLSDAVTVNRFPADPLSLTTSVSLAARFTSA